MAKKQKYIAASVFNAGGREYKPGEVVKLTEEEVKPYLITGMVYEKTDDNVAGKSSDDEITSMKETVKEKDEKIKELEKEVEALKAQIISLTEKITEGKETEENEEVKTK